MWVVPLALLLSSAFVLYLLEEIFEFFSPLWGAVDSYAPHFMLMGPPLYLLGLIFIQLSLLNHTYQDRDGYHLRKQNLASPLSKIIIKTNRHCDTSQ